MAKLEGFNPIDFITKLATGELQIPPAPIVIGAVSRMAKDAIEREILSRPIPADYMDAMRSTKRFANDEEITKIYVWTVRAALEGKVVA